MSKPNLTEVNGNILEQDLDAIVHQANCFKRMKSGIAKSITDLYPEVREADNAYPYEVGPDRLGRCSFAITKHKDSGKKLIIGNLYGQEYYGGVPGIIYTRYSALRSAFQKFSGVMDSLEYKHATIGIPYGIGCGLAHGDWEIVHDIIREAASNAPHHKFVIVRYDRA